MIKYPDRFHQASPAGFDGIFDWDFILPAFEGTKITPMDIDAMVERNGKFLLFETKCPGKEIPQGQVIALTNLIIMGKGNVSLLVIYGKSEFEIEAVERWYYFNGRLIKEGYEMGNSNKVLELVSNWFKWTNRQRICIT